MKIISIQFGIKWVLDRAIACVAAAKLLSIHFFEQNNEVCIVIYSSYQALSLKIWNSEISNSITKNQWIMMYCYIFRVEAVTLESNLGPITRLKLYLEKIQKARSVPEPDGRVHQSICN